MEDSGGHDRGDLEREGGKYTKRVTDDEIVAAVRTHNPAATSEVADEIDMTRQGADRRLRQLRDEGRVNSKKIAKSLVWFPASGSGTVAASTSSSDGVDTNPQPAGEPIDDRRDEWVQVDPEASEIDKDSLETATAAVDVLEDWVPDDEINTERARSEAQRAVAWLREDGGRKTKSEFVDALVDESPYGERIFWERAVRPALRDLASDEIGLVDYRSGHHDYQWIGDGD